MKKGVIIGISIFAAIFLLFGALIFIFVRNYLDMDKWDVHNTLTDHERESLSYRVLMPEAADSFVSYGARGFRDPEYQVETAVYGSVEDLCNAMPESTRDGIKNAVANSDPKEGEDIRYGKVTLYEVTEGVPMITEDEVIDEYKALSIGCFREYYVIGYPDGTFRFVAILITT